MWGESESVCVRDRECERERARRCVCEKESVCVREREYVRESESVYVCERETARHLPVAAAPHICMHTHLNYV